MKLREGVGFPSTCKSLDRCRRTMAWRDANGFYRILGVTPEATDKEIRRAGRELLRRYHPDGTEPDEERFLAVEEAYRTLTNNRAAYDATPEGHVMVTESNRTDRRLTPPPSRYTGWSYFSEVPRVTDDAVALWAYEQYLDQALSTPTSLPRISVVLIEGPGEPWLDDGLIWVPTSGFHGRVVPTPSQGAERQG